MQDSLWTDERFRSFLSTMRGGVFGPGVDDAEREEFLRQARARIVPGIRQRLLGEVGATVSAEGIAVVAFEVLEESAWDERRTWIMATSDPWGFLADLVVRAVASAYAATMAVGGDDEQLTGILAASTRLALGSADGAGGAGDVGGVGGAGEDGEGDAGLAHDRAGGGREG